MSLLDVLARFKDARILVMGDVMLDRFIYGRISRISPEAPVPVLKIERETASLGGAGNVARNVASLGGMATLLGGAGKDSAGERIEELLKGEPRIGNALLTAPSFRTTEKIRYIADHQQVMRADSEMHWSDGDGALSGAEALLARHQALVISDYAKGFLDSSLVSGLIGKARRMGKLVIADPKGSNFAPYDGASVITPNKQEAQAATGLEAESDRGVEACARKILKDQPQLSAVIITRGPQGLSLLPRDGDIVHVPAKSRDVFDVSGAGDTVVAALALALAAGADLSEAAKLANEAAGIAVSLVGTAAVTADALANALHARQLEGVEKKIVSDGRALEWIMRWRAKSERIGFTNGCFDLIHPGHISLLRQAREKCDHLVVGLNSDASVRRLKGMSRPLQNEMARAVVLASLAMVDLVVIFGEDTPEQLIRLLCPDVLVKGADYRQEDIVGADFVSSYGGEVVRAELVEGMSSSGLIAKVQERSS